MVRDAAPTGNASSDRSCGQPELTVTAAAGPATEMATLRCEMPTAECSADTLAQSASGSLPASSKISHSSGPSHSAVRPPFVAEVFGFAGKATPSALESAAAEACGARSEMRSAGGKISTLTPGADTERPASAGRRSTDAEASAAFVLAAALAIEAFSLLVDEHHARHLHLDRPVRHRHVERLAHAVAAAGDQRQRDRAPAILRPV